MAKDKRNNSLHNAKNYYAEYAVPEEIKEIAETFWSFRTTPAKNKPAGISFLPTHQSELLVIKKDGKITNVILDGPRLMKNSFKTTKKIYIFGISLAPFAALRYLGFYKNKLFRDSISLDKALNKSEYENLINNINISSTDEEHIAVFTEFLLSRKNNIKLIDSNIENLCRLIIDTHGEKKLEEYYSAFAVNKRQLQRKFKDISGISAKEFARLVRIQHAGSELIKIGFKHLDVMFKYGYYDQSHYIKEFKRILGSSPKDFEKSQKKIEYKFIK